MQEVYQYRSPFQTAIDRMGGTAIFGQPVSDAIQTDDGNLEQVFSTVVVYAPSDNPTAIRLRPLSKMLGMTETAPGPKQFDMRQNVIFYPVDGELGYHVPVFFDEFIAAHGGQEISGNPISDTFKVTNSSGKDVARQCFENYCLEYDPTAPKGQNTRLSELGRQYAQINNLSGVASPADQNLSLMVSTDKSEVASSESQIFYLLAYKRRSLEPASDAVARVELTLPDGTVNSYRSDPTGANGWVSMTIPPLTDTTNGTVVAYKICLENSDGSATDPTTCVSDTFVIWNNQ
jgi:hypothetical protein